MSLKSRALPALLAALAPALAAAQKEMRLNNLVTELFRADLVRTTPETSFPVHNPRSGWVYFSLRAEPREGERVELLQGDRVLISIAAGQGPTGEAMRRLPEGSHSLRVRAAGVPACGPLIVRPCRRLISSAIRRNRGFPSRGSLAGSGFGRMC